MSIYRDNNSVYPMQNWLPQSGLYANNKSLVFNVPTVEQPIIPNAPSTQRVADVKSAVNNAFISDKAKLANRTKIRVDAGMAESSKVAGNGNTLPPPSSKGSLSTVGAANIATGISTAANVVTSIYGAVQASKMKPALMKYQAPTEAILVDDNSSAIETAGKENIDKSINTARDSFKRAGLAGMDGILLSKENEGLNQLSGQLSQYRTGIDSQNAQIQNSVNAQNKQTAMQVDQFNASTQNQFDQYKSGLIGTAMKNATDSIQSGTESIFGNMMAGSQMQLSSINSEISTIMEQLKNPNAEIFNKDLRTRLETLQKKKEQLGNSVFGQTNLKV